LDPALAAAFVGAGGIRHKVLGVELPRPFCSWHQFLLGTLDSPLLQGAQAYVTLFDLRNAVGVCRLGFGEVRIQRPLVIIPRIRRKAREQWLGREIARFLDYAGDYIVKPEFAVIPRTANAPGAPPPPPPPVVSPVPELMCAIGDVIAWSGWEAKPVWEMALSQLHWYRMLALREKGALISYLDEEEREIQRRMKEEADAAEADTQGESDGQRAG
jgi:hypothetical protein